MCYLRKPLRGGLIMGFDRQQIYRLRRGRPDKPFAENAAGSNFIFSVGHRLKMCNCRVFNYLTVKNVSHGSIISEMFGNIRR